MSPKVPVHVHRHIDADAVQQHCAKKRRIGYVGQQTSQQPHKDYYQQQRQEEERGRSGRIIQKKDDNDDNGDNCLSGSAPAPGSPALSVTLFLRFLSKSFLLLLLLLLLLISSEEGGTIIKSRTWRKKNARQSSFVVLFATAFQYQHPQYYKQQQPTQHRIVPRLVSESLPSPSSSSIILYMSLATPPTPPRSTLTASSTPASTTLRIPKSEEELKSMTVTQLKEFIKAVGWNERGLFSKKLKKKQDMIDFVLEKKNKNSNPAMNQPQQQQQQRSTTTERQQSQHRPNTRKKKPLSMPQTSRLASSTAATPATATTTATLTKNKEIYREVKLLEKQQQQRNPNQADQDQQQQEETSFAGSGVFQTVETMYPTLKYIQDGNRTLLGEFDLRQRYHPMLVEQWEQQRQKVQDEEEATRKFKEDYNNIIKQDTNNTNTNTSLVVKTQERIIDDDEEEEDAWKRTSIGGDMDLIFIGTASCTPSMTRGVSCTALRMHSTHSSVLQNSPTYQKIQNGQQQQLKNNNGHPQQKKQQKIKKINTRDNSPSASTNSGTWLFDCGEGTQLQIQRTATIRPSKITKIFITHAHGDHSFGLPGLLCLMGQDTAAAKNDAGQSHRTKDTKPPIEIYGPEGLRAWLRVAIRYSVSRIVPRYRVHELKDVAMAPEWGYSPQWEKYFYNKTAYYDNISRAKRQQQQQHNQQTATIASRDSSIYWGKGNRHRVQSATGETSDWVTQCELRSSSSETRSAVSGLASLLEPSKFYSEVPGGRDIYPRYDHPLSNDGAPVWDIIDPENNDDDDDGGGIRVYAAPMSHGVPCVGYVVEEPVRPGRLRDEYVTPICKRNIKALKEAGYRHPMKALAVIKDLPEGGSFTFPDGTIVTKDDAVEPNRPGRKVVICGDTNSARSLEKLAQNADVVVHEATNTFLHSLDPHDRNLKSATRDAIHHGHSTPHIAGEFCKRTKAKRLIMNHFSSRYMGDQSLESISVMTRIEEQAMKASGLSRGYVAAAWDFMIFPIPKMKKKNTSNDNGNSTDQNTTSDTNNNE